MNYFSLVLDSRRDQNHSSNKLALIEAEARLPREVMKKSSRNDRSGNISLLSDDLQVKMSEEKSLYILSLP